MRTIARRVSAEDGFSLVEVLVASSLLVIVTVAGLAVTVSAYQTERGQEARATSLTEQRGAINRVSKEIRQAIEVDTTSTTSRLAITTYIGGTERDVVYDVADGKFRRTLDGGSPVPLVDGLTSDDAFCYDPPDCLLTSPDSSTPALIRLTLTVQPGTTGARPVTLATDVHLRNP